MELLTMPTNKPGQHKCNNYDAVDKQLEEHTIEEILDHIGIGWPQIKIMMLGGIIWVALGMELMVVSILGPILAYEWNISPSQQALLTTMMFTGFTIGSLISGYLSDKFGRRKTLVLSSIWSLLYAILCTLAPNYEWLAILRMLLGIGLAAANQFTSYYAEFMPRKYRGKMVIAALMFWAAGSSLTVLTAIALTRYGWRLWLLMSAVPSFVFILISPALPESPRFLLACGDTRQAWRILEGLAHGNGRVLPNVTIKQLEMRRKGMLTDLFVPELRRTTFFLCIAWFVGGLTYFGMTLFTTYLVQVGSTCSTDLQTTGKVPYCKIENNQLSIKTLWELLFPMVADLPAILVCIVVVDTLGRKGGMILQLVIYVLVCSSLLICMSRIPMIILLFIGRCASAGWTQMLFLYTNEVFPTEIRGISLGCGQIVNSLGGLITPSIAQLMFQYSAQTGLIMYAGLGIIGSIALLLLPIETKDLEMADHFLT